MNEEKAISIKGDLVSRNKPERQQGIDENVMFTLRGAVTHCVIETKDKKEYENKQVTMNDKTYDGEPLRVLELFNGYGTATFALKRAGIPHKLVGYSDIDTYANKIFKLNHCPDDKNNSLRLGDVTKIDPEDVGDIDLLTGGFPCVLKGTLITTKRGMIPIEEVVVGDQVLTHKNRWRSVITTMKQPSDHYYEVSVQGCPELFITEEHPFYAKKTVDSEPEWIPTKELSKKHLVGLGTCEWAVFENKERVNKRVTVYNIEVEEDNSYVANNIILHNCQAFSVAGRMAGEADPRGTLFYEIIRIAEKKQPRYMLLENVEGLTYDTFRPTFKKILSELDRIGYNVYWDVLNTKDYGIPQSRSRVWFVCFRKDVDQKKFVFPKPIELELFVKDILEPTVDKKYYLSPNLQERFKEYLVEKNLGSVARMVGRNPDNPGLREAGAYVEQTIEFVSDKRVSNTLSTVQKDNLVLDNYNKNLINNGTIGTLGSNCGCATVTGSFSIIEPAISGIELVFDARTHFDEETPRAYEGISPTLMARARTDETPIVLSGELPSSVNINPSGNGMNGEVFLGEVMPALTTNKGEGKKILEQKRVHNALTQALGRGGHSSEELGYLLNNMLSGRLRRLTPRECFRLMGFLDDEILFGDISDTQLYKLAGNGQDVNLVCLLFKQMFGLGEDRFQPVDRQMRLFYD